MMGQQTGIDGIIGGDEAKIIGREAHEHFSPRIGNGVTLKQCSTLPCQVVMQR
jgi:hypothetical protein